MKTIAVDFDGIIVKDEYPNVGAPILENIDYLKDLQSKGYHLILHTCRAGRFLEDAVRYCISIGLVFTAINDQDPMLKALWKDGSSCKPYADIYFDDHAVSSLEELKKITTNEEEKSISNN